MEPGLLRTGKPSAVEAEGEALSVTSPSPSVSAFVSSAFSWLMLVLSVPGSVRLPQ